ncbi:MAG: TerC/Alx family metal homeostasis membrane protein [Chlamydiia bacterium]|nr:TerC/Alx family metal homeostasis membrane protein [Chlamydiia bacterium]
MGITIWIAFLLLIVGFVACDLGLFSRRSHEMNVKESMRWTALWIVLALLFNAVIYFLYGKGEEGRTAALQFFTGYLLEKSLSLDNIFVISAIFHHFHIPHRHQHRVLTIGILTAVVLRGVMILSGTYFIQKFSWLLYPMGALLVGTGIRFFLTKQEEKAPDERWIVHVISSFWPVDRSRDSGHFFTKKEGVRHITPLFLALLHIEIADVIFAFDSIPAIFAITLDPFIIFTSNIFAILGLRALYFALAALIRKFSALKASLALILIYIGSKMILLPFVHIPAGVSLGVVAGIIVGGIVVSSLNQPTRGSLD